MDNEIQGVQEKEYGIPYHYLITSDKLVSFPFKLIACPQYIFYMRKIESLLCPFHGQTILDIGCGDGRFISEMRNKKAHLFGVDYSFRPLRFARVFNPHALFSQGDLTKQIAFAGETFDQVVSMETLEHIHPDHIGNAINEIHRVLRPGGTAILTVPHRNRKLDKKHYQHFTATSLNEILRYRFKVEFMQGFHRKSFFLNLPFNLLILAYYYLYPLGKIGPEKGIGKLSRLGYRFFERYLQDCPPDEGFALICMARKA